MKHLTTDKGESTPMNGDEPRRYLIIISDGVLL